MILYDRPYLCRIPKVPLEEEPARENNTTDATQAEKQQQELVRASSHGTELLAGMQGHCLFYPAGWWVYSFCYNSEIKQFHPLAPGRPGVPLYPPVEDTTVASFILGKFKQGGGKQPRKEDPDQSAQQTGAASETGLSTQLETRGATNYLVQHLSDGTECDLTGRDRRIEVQFHCNPASPDHIHLIRETAICAYLMVIHTPRLCNDVAFMPQQLDRPNPIACQEIVGKEEEGEWMARKAYKAKQEIFRGLTGGMSEDELLRGLEEDAAAAAADDKEDKNTPQKPIVIGGIELGGQKLVGGSPERTIKVSNIIQPARDMLQQEKYIVTLAKSDGKYTTVLSEKEIKKHGIKGDQVEMEKFVDQVEKWAEGQPWKIDVVQTPDGMQFRGMLVEEREIVEETARKDDAAVQPQGQERERGQAQGQGQGQDSGEQSRENGGGETRRGPDDDDDDDGQHPGSHEEYRQNP